MERYLCIHGHFYQPPRENPWLEAVEVEDSAYPYHDWNERINAECYAPNTASRIVSADGYIIDIVNNYSKMSFNFGPTLLAWMEIEAPETYQAILEADSLSKEHFSGHGSALAQVYNHVIMPLANNRDKRTQVVWGISDFKQRFGREPEGMWLSETAVDLETLDLLVEHGIRFTILAPRQAKGVRPVGQLAEDLGVRLERDFVEQLSRIPSNVFENGAKVYEALVKPAQVDILRVAAHYVISSLFSEHRKEHKKKVYSYLVEDLEFDRVSVGPGRLATGRSLFYSNLSGEKADAVFAAFHFGDVNLTAGVCHFTDEGSFQRMRAEVREAFDRGSVPETIGTIHRHFVPPYNYTLWHLFKDEQRRVVKEILREKFDQVDDLFKTIYEGNYWIMNFLRSLNNPVPKPFYAATEATVNLGLWKVFNGEFNIERLEDLIRQANTWPISIDREGLQRWASQWIEQRMRELEGRHQDPEAVLLIEKVKDTIQLLSGLALDLDL